jgi:general secretion pathway protein F
MQFHWPSLDVLRKLSPEEATELAARVAELTKAGLPLGGGLRALAAELSGRRLPRVLESLADRLDAGEDLSAALNSVGGCLPPHLRGLVLAGLQSGRLAEALEEYVDIERCQSDLRRRLLSSLLYPYFLLALLTALVVFARLYIIGGFDEIFKSFCCAVPTLTTVVIHGSWAVMWVMVVLLGALTAVPLFLTVVPRSRLLWSVLYKVPMLGPSLRFGHVAQFARLMSLLTRQEIPLPDALRLTAGALRDANLGLACRRVAESVENGWKLDEAMTASRRFPASMMPLVEWGEQTAALPDAFHEIAEMFEGRLQSQGSMLKAVLLPVVFFVIVFLIGLFIVAMMLPLISLISALSSCTWDYRRAHTDEAAVITVAIAVGVFGFLALAVCRLAFRQRQTAKRCSLLWLLAVSAERQMPLGPAVEAFARERGGLFGRRVKRLAKLLAMGAPLPSALDFCPGLVPDQSLPIIRIGYGSGALAPALRQAATVQNQYTAIWTALAGKVSYLLALPVFAIGILTWIMIWVIPRFTKIFYDFHAQLPGMTRSLINVCYVCANYWFVASPLFLLIGFLLVYSLMRYFGWTDWELPGTSRLARRLDTARILDSLAIVAQQQRPMLEGVATLAGTYPKSSVRRLLSLVLNDVESGGDWAEVLHERGLVRRVDLSLLRAAQHVGNLPWAMREMADSNRRRFVYRLQAIVQAAFPPVVIFFGLIVMFIAVGIFLPLVALIRVLA